MTTQVITATVYSLNSSETNATPANNIFPTPPQHTSDSVLDDPSSTVYNSVELFRNSTQTYQKNLVETYTTENTPDFSNSEYNFYNLHISNSLNGVPSCSFEVILPNTSTSESKDGDIVQIQYGYDLLFLGYIYSSTLTFSEKGKTRIINCKGLTDRMNKVNLLSKLALVDNKAANEQIGFNRKLKEMTDLIAQNTLLEYISIYADMDEDSLFTAFYNTATTCYEALSMYVRNYSRYLLQRKTGDLFLTQLFGSESITKYFNSYSYDDLIVEEYSRTLNYSEVPKEINIVYENSHFLTNSLITGKIVFNGEYPNNGTYYESTYNTPLNLSSTMGLNILNSGFTLPPTANSVYSIEDVKISLLENGGEYDQSIVQARLQLDLVNQLYRFVPAIDQTSLKLVLTELSYPIDVGDTIQIEGENYSVTSTVSNWDEATVDIGLIPLQFTNPIITPVAQDQLSVKKKTQG